MPPIVVSGAAFVTLRWDLGGTGAVNVLGANVLPTTTINQGLAETLDAAIKSSFTSIIAANMPASSRLVSVGVRDIRSPNLAEFVGTGAAVPGTGVGDALPKQTAFAVTLRTARAGQSFRGRVYLGGWFEAANEVGGTAAAGIATLAVNFVTAIGTSLSGNGLALAVVSRPSERKTVVTTVNHADGTTSTDTKVTEARSGQVTNVTAIVARNLVWDTQRRRASAGSSSTLLAVAAHRVLEPSQNLP